MNKGADIDVELIDHMGTDLTTVNAARVSFDKHSEWAWVNKSGQCDKDGNCENPLECECGPGLSDADAALTKYLARNKHMSPFGHAFMSFRITAPIFVVRQLVKHEYLRMNEVSRRYVKSRPEFYGLQWRWASVSAKQGSLGPLDEETAKKADDIFWPLVDHSIDAYDQLLELGVCPEQARAALLLDHMTSWWWSGSLDAFANMCSLRLHPHAQWESRVVAEKISDIAHGLFPVSWRELMENAS